MAPQISKAKINHIKELWRCTREYGLRAKRKRMLEIFINRVVKVSVLEFLTYKKANQVICAIKKIQQKKAKDGVEAVKMLMRNLSPGQRRTLQKFYPFREERNELIRSLRRDGIGYGLLARTSGLGKTQIWKITKEGEKERLSTLAEFIKLTKKGGDD